MNKKIFVGMFVTIGFVALVTPVAARSSGDEKYETPKEGCSSCNQNQCCCSVVSNGVTTKYCALKTDACCTLK